MGILEPRQQGVTHAPPAFDFVGVWAAFDQRDHDIGGRFRAGQRRDVGAADLLGIRVLAVRELFSITLDRVERVLP
ncbi:hypothetical protein D3C87_1804170 [compost metagenome]